VLELKKERAWLITVVWVPKAASGRFGGEFWRQAPFLVEARHVFRCLSVFCYFLLTKKSKELLLGKNIRK